MSGISPGTRLTICRVKAHAALGKTPAAKLPGSKTKGDSNGKT